MEKEYEIFVMKTIPSTNGEENYSFSVVADSDSNAYLKAKNFLIEKYNLDPTSYHIILK